MQQEAGGEGAEERLLAGRKHRTRAERRGEKAALTWEQLLLQEMFFLFSHSELEDIFGFWMSHRNSRASRFPLFLCDRRHRCHVATRWTATPFRSDASSPAASDGVAGRRHVTRGAPSAL